MTTALSRHVSSSVATERVGELTVQLDPHPEAYIDPVGADPPIVDPVAHLCPGDTAARGVEDVPFVPVLQRRLDPAVRVAEEVDQKPTMSQPVTPPRLQQHAAGEHTLAHGVGHQRDDLVLGPQLTHQVEDGLVDAHRCATCRPPQGCTCRRCTVSPAAW